MDAGGNVPFPTATATCNVTGVPVVLDYRLRTAVVAGLDRSRYLTARGFQGIAPGNSATFNLVASGSGYANVVTRDAYV